MSEANQEQEDKLVLLTNGRLDKKEADELQRAIKEHPDLADEARFMATLAEGIKREPVTPPGAMGLARLKRDIAAEAATAEPKKTTHNRWKLLAIAACFILSIQTGYMGFNRMGGPAVDIAPLAGTPLAGTPLPGNNGQAGPQLQLVLSDDATAQQIQNALLVINARIIDGPGALGVYTIALPKDSDAQSVQKALQQLEFVEEVSAL